MIKKYKMKKFLSEEDGQSVAELCVILPILLFLILAMLSVGLLVYTKLLVTFAAGQAADRAAEVMDSTTLTYNQKVKEVEEVAYAYLSNGITGNERDVDIARDGEKLTVTVTYKFTFIFNFTNEVFRDMTEIDVKSVAVDYVD